MKHALTVLTLTLATLSAVGESVCTIQALNATRRSPACDRPFDFTLSGSVYMTWPKAFFLLVNGGHGVVLRGPQGALPPLDAVVRVCGQDRRASDWVHTPNASSIEILHERIAPVPTPATVGEIQSGALDYRFIRTEGTVIDAASDEISYGYIQVILMADGQTVSLATYMDKPDQRWIDSLRNARISVTGLCDPRIGSLRYLHRRGLLTRPDGIRILKPAPADAEEIRSLLELGLPDYEKISSIYRRYLIDGRVAASWQGDHLLVTATNGLNARITLAKGLVPPAVGSYVRAIGFPETDLYTINLASAVWQGLSAPPNADESPKEPIPLTADKLFETTTGSTQYNAFYHCKTVRLRGQALNVPDLVLGETDMHLNSNGSTIAVNVKAVGDALSDVSVGCQVEVTGLCLLDTENWRPSVPFPRARSVFVVTRGPADLRVLYHPPWWTPGRLLIVIGSLLAALLGVFVWNRALQRIIEKRSRQLFRARLARTASELRVEERTRLAVELHDAMSQNISSAALQINAAERLSETDTAKERHHLQIAAKTLQSCREELRNCIWDLRNQSFDEPDLNKTITRMLNLHLSGVALAVRFDVPRKLLTDNTVNLILKTVRELAINAVRHGQATTVRIAGTTDCGQVLFSVTDNGCGFDPDDVPGVSEGHFGLQGIRERVRQLNGKLKIKSSPGHGTRVKVILNAGLLNRRGDDWT